MNPLSGDDDAGGLLAGEEMDGLKASGESEERAAADHEAELAGRVGIDDGEDHHGSAENRHAGGDGDGGPLAAGEMGVQAHLKEALGGGIDAELRVVDEVDLHAVAPGVCEARQPVLLRGADGVGGGDGLGRRRGHSSIV